MSATIRLNGFIAHLDNKGVWTCEVEGFARILNTEMIRWEWDRPKDYLSGLLQDKIDALHMIEKFGNREDDELIEYTVPSTEGVPPDAVF